MALHKRFSVYLLFTALIFSAAPSRADMLNVAAASNLTHVMPALVSDFEAAYPHIKIRLSIASSGSLYAQVLNGAPFDVFLSADAERPLLLGKAGLVSGEPFSYASGGLVLWSPSGMGLVEGLFVLSSPKVKRVALANPRHAPYGEAARAALEEAGLLDVLKDKLVFSENISQAAQFTQSGAADVAFVAESMLHSGALKGGSSYVLPEGTYPAIMQMGVLLKGGKNGREGQVFRDYLNSQRAAAIFRDFGYGVR